MPKRSSTARKDLNQLAASIVDAATFKSGKQTDALPAEKNPAAVALGRLGGLKGGFARAQKLTAKKRTAIAKKAAASRWSKKST